MNYRFIPVLLCSVTVAFLCDRPTALHAQVDSTLSFKDNPDQDFRTITITRNDQFAIATHHDRLTAWELASGKQVYSLKRGISDVFYDKTANRVLFTDGEGNELLELVLDASPAEWTVRTIVSEFQDQQPLAISPDGHYMALRIEYDYFGILDLTTKKLIFRNELEEVEQATFSSDGKLVSLALDRGENAVVTYSIPDGQQVASTASFLSSARRLAYSPDGNALAVTCVMGGASSLVLLGAEDLRPIRGAKFPIYVYPADCAVGWSGDGMYLAASGVEGSENTIGVYDVQNKKRLVLLRGYSADSLAMNGDGSRIASVTADEPGVVWWDWQADLRFRGPRNSVASHPRLDASRDENSVDFRLQFSRDGKSLALAMPMPDENGAKKPLKPTDEPGLAPDFDFGLLDDEAAYIFLLDSTSGKTSKAMFSKVQDFKDDDYYIRGEMFDSLEFSPDGKTLACLFCEGSESSGHLVLWDVAGAKPSVRMLIKEERDTWREGWIDLTYVQDGNGLLLLPYDHDDLGVQLFDLNTSTIKNTVRGGFASSLLLLPDAHFASGFATWDYLSGDALYRENSGSADDYHPLARTAGETIVGVYREERLGRWDLDTLKVTYPFAAHRDSNGVKIHCLASSPSRQLIATGCVDRLIRIWDSTSGRLLLNLRGHRRAVDALCFSPDGNTLASASRDGTTRFWDVGDLEKHEASIENPELPTRWTCRTAQGATVTVLFDRPATEKDIESALQDAQSQMDNR